MQPVLEDDAGYGRDDTAQAGVGGMFGGLGLFRGHRFLQPVEGSGQLADFVHFADRQCLAGNPAFLHLAEQGRGFGKRCQLPAQPPASEQCGEDGEQCRDQQQVLLHRADRREGFVGWQHRLHQPAGAGNLLARRQFDHAARAEGDAGTFVAIDVTVVHRVQAGRRTGFLEAALVGRSDVGAAARRGNEEVAGSAVFRGADFVEEIRFGKIDDADHDAKDFAVRVLDGHLHGYHRLLAVLAEQGVGDARPAVGKDFGDDRVVAEIDAAPPALAGGTGDCDTVRIDDQDAPVEGAGRNVALFEIGLDGIRVAHRLGGELAGNRFDDAQAFADRAVEFVGDQGNRRKLLRRNGRFHVFAQRMAQAEHGNPQHGQGGD